MQKQESQQKKKMVAMVAVFILSAKKLIIFEGLAIILIVPFIALSEVGQENINTLLAALITLLFLISFLFLFRSYKKGSLLIDLPERGHEASAKITKMGKKQSNTENIFLDYTFRNGGKEYKGRSLYVASDSPILSKMENEKNCPETKEAPVPKVGDAITVLYRRQDPSVNMWTGGMLFKTLHEIGE